MYRTVEDILLLESFKDAKIIAGQEGLSKIVNNASLMEVPDIIPYVEANTLLITTMYPIAGETDKIDQLIPQLFSKQVAGICIKPLRYIEEIPKLMCSQAEELAFPIIELPLNANLSTCVNEILSVSLNDHINQLQFRNQVHQSMIELLLEGAGIEALTKKLAETVERNIILLDKDYMNICSAVFQSESGAWEVIKGTYGRPLDRKELELRKDYILFPIQAGNSLFGFIFIPNCESQNENLRIAVGQAAMLFAAVFFKDDVALMHRKTFRDGFLRELLTGKINSETELKKKMEAFGVSLRFPLFVMVIKLISDSEDQKHRFYNQLIDEKRVEKMVQSFFGRKQSGDMVYLNDSLIMLLPVKKEETVAEFAEYLKEIFEKTGHFGGRIGIGISREMKRWDCIARGYKQAAAMINIGKTIYRESYVSTYSENRVYELIEKIGDTELLEEYVKDKLGVLLDYDRENQTELTATLQELIRYNFNYKVTAEHSYLHYNTIRYRAAKIQQLGISFEQGQNLAEVVFAYNVYLWLKATGHLI